MSAPAACPAELVPLVAACLAPTVTERGSSYWRELQRCEQAHHLRYHLGIYQAPHARSEDLGDKADYFELGQLVHGALAYVQLHHEQGAKWWHVINHAAAERTAEGEPRWDPLAVFEAERLLRGYFATYPTATGWPDGAELVMVEELLQHEWQGACDVCGGAGTYLDRQHGDYCPSVYTCACFNRNVIGRYTARLDTLLRIGGELVIVDTKTRARAFPEDRGGYARGVATNPQFLGQAFLVMQHFKLEAPPLLWVNAMVKTKVPQYDRLRVEFSPRAIEQWAANQQRLSARPAGDSSSCVMNYSACAPEIGSRCWAFGWCHGTAETRARNYIQGGPR